MSEALTQIDIPDYPMERDARCPFAPPPQMLGNPKRAIQGTDLGRQHPMVDHGP